MNKILYIGENDTNHLVTSNEVTELSDIENQIILSEYFPAFILSTDQESLFLSWVSKIRHSPLNFTSLIYSNNPDFADKAMVDGLLPNDIDASIVTLIERISEIKTNSNDNLENKLLAYLWAVENRSLQPVRVLDEGIRYQYPFLDLWDDNKDKDFWINHLLKSNILIQDKLVDRIRQCASCSSSLLNYVDSCAHCGSIDLKQEQALHCFVCGHIGDQKEFIRTGEMVCPNCFNTLRHIGSDYDRPIENQRCNTCHNLSMESNVKVTCFNCEHDNAIDDLIEKQYFRFCIGHNGIIKVKTGTDPLYLTAALGEPVSREHFAWMINWLNKMAIRQDEQHLFLALKFENLLSLTQSMSIIALTAQLDAFTIRLQSMLRTTDIFCQYNDDSLYFLIPNISPESVNVIEIKLAKISEEQSDNPLNLKILLKLLPQLHLSSDVDLWLADCIKEFEE